MNKLFLITLFLFLTANVFCQDNDSLTLDSKKINFNLFDYSLSNPLTIDSKSNFDFQVNPLDSDSKLFLPNSSYDIYSNGNRKNPNARRINPNSLCGEPQSFIISGALNFIKQTVDLRVKFK